MPTSVFFREWDDWHAIERSAIDHVRGSVLDIGCGAGPHAVELTKRGHEVTVIDTSPGAVEVCRRRGVVDGFAGTVEDYAAGIDRRYETVLMMGHNLALLESRERASVVLAAVTTLAAPGAVIIGTNLDPYQSDDVQHLAYQERNRSLGRMAAQIRMRVRYRELATEWFDYLFMSRGELEALIAGSGWIVERFEAEAPSYLAVLRLEG